MTLHSSWFQETSQQYCLHYLSLVMNCLDLIHLTYDVFSELHIHFRCVLQVVLKSQIPNLAIVHAVILLTYSHFNSIVENAIFVLSLHQLATDTLPPYHSLRQPSSPRQV